MTPARLTPASRIGVQALLGVLLFGILPVIARDFSTRTISEPERDARYPAIGETGLVAWQGSTEHASDSPLTIREDVLRGSTTARRTDIFTWRDGAVSNITAEETRIIGRSQQPVVHKDSVLFTAWYRNDADGGYPFELSLPPKDDTMRRMESEYPSLFDPPLPAPESAVEAEAGVDVPETEIPEIEEDAGDDSSLQRQDWRGSGKSGDVTLYNPDGTVQRITPGTRHFGSPVMSDSGIAFQVARGWPYGYEMLIWRPGDTELTQITTNYFYVLNPDIHGDELVFQAWDGVDYEIFRYRFDTGETEQITNNQFDDIHPVVWDGQIAWIAHPTVNAEIFHVRDGVIRKISENSQDNGAPSMWEGRVVWHGYDDTDLEIYYFNGSRTIKLTSNAWDDLSPVLRDGVIAWMSYVANSDAEIMALDLSDNISVQLTENDWEDGYPDTAGERVVWQTLAPEGASVQLAEPDTPREAPIN